jgi:hypothetical protein
MWQKVIELSQLPIFAGDDMGRILYVIVLIVIIVAILIFSNLVIRGIIKVWTTLCNTIKESLMEVKRQETEQLRLTGGKSTEKGEY